MPDYPSGTVAFLFTDIEGSTRRWETQQQVMWAAVRRHFELLGGAITAHDGVLFKTIGDAVQAAFPIVPAAVSAAVEAQAALRNEEWGELGPLRVRLPHSCPLAIRCATSGNVASAISSRRRGSSSSPALIYQPTFLHSRVLTSSQTTCQPSQPHSLAALKSWPRCGRQSPTRTAVC